MFDILEITTTLGFALRLFIAIVLGFLVGLERQWTKHQAGIMTNVIVCVGAYAYTAFSFILGGNQTDLTRVAAQIVSGIGFLGAGLIIRDGTNIRGLSSAATIWTTAAIGILCTLDNILYAVIVTTAIVILHLVLHPVSSYLNSKRHIEKKNIIRDCFYKISITCLESNEVEIRTNLMHSLRNTNKLILHNLESSDTDEGNTKIRAYVYAEKKNDEAVEEILNHIGKDEGILSAGWKITE